MRPFPVLDKGKRCRSAWAIVRNAGFALSPCARLRPKGAIFAPWSGLNRINWLCSADRAEKSGAKVRSPPISDIPLSANWA